MEAARRRWIEIIVGATLVIAAGSLVWFELTAVPPSHIEALFSDDSPEPVWPPRASADLEAELQSTAAAQQIGASADVAFDAGLLDGDVPGLQVRADYAQGLYYIEAVIGHRVSFDDPMPMAVVIHGRGDHARIPGGPFWGLGSPIRIIVPQAPDPLGRGFEWLPVRVGENLVDRLTTSLLTRANQLAAMLRELMQTRATEGRALVVGFSQGGLLTFTLATHHSDVVQAAFPLAAWLPPALVPPYLREDLDYPRIRGVHGTADPIIAPEPTSELYELLRTRGFDAELELFEGVEHEMTASMNARLHEWLREEIGVVLEERIAAGRLDGGVAPCVPLGEWPSELRPEGGWPEGGGPEAGLPDGEIPPWTPCPETNSAPDAGASEAGTAPEAGATP